MLSPKIADMIAEDLREEIASLPARVHERVAEVLSSVDVYFPKEWAPDGDGWRGKDVDDPLTLYFVADEESEVLMKTSLVSMLGPSIEACRADGSFAYGLSEISKAMKVLAARIDEACAEHTEKRESEG